MPFKKGYKRHPNAGIKLGQKTKKTLLKEEALKEFKDSVVRDLKELYLAGRKSATGLMVMYQRKLVKNPKTNKYERTGELIRVTDPYQIETLLNSEGEGEDWYYIAAKDPNIHAFTALMDRTFGKAKESLEITGEDGGPIPIDINIKSALDKAYGTNKENE